MANEKRLDLIDRNALRERMFSYYGCVNENTSKEYYRGETLMNYEVADMIEDCIDNAPTVDAVILPKGKPGDYVLWANGVCERLFEIYSIMICKDGIRYDLGDLSPFVNHSHILKIMNLEEAERWMENGKRETAD